LRERGGLPDPEQAYLTGNVEDIDDFSACKIPKKEDWVELYAKPDYFGCEADDRMNATAFGRGNPFESAPSPSPMRSSCGVRRTRNSSRAPASPTRPPRSSPRRKPDPRRRRITPIRIVQT